MLIRRPAACAAGPDSSATAELGGSPSPSTSWTISRASSSMDSSTQGPLFNFKVVCCYDGSAYMGFQLQQGRPRTPTIQQQLEEVVCKVVQEDREVLKMQAAGRTDAGVHAAGQVVQFSCHREQDPAVLLRALNGLLPPDIRALEVHFYNAPAVALPLSPPAALLPCTPQHTPGAPIHPVLLLLLLLPAPCSLPRQVASMPLEWNVRWAASKTYHYRWAAVDSFLFPFLAS